VRPSFRCVCWRPGRRGCCHTDKSHSDHSGAGTLLSRLRALRELTSSYPPSASPPRGPSISGSTAAGGEEGTDSRLRTSASWDHPVPLSARGSLGASHPAKSWPSPAITSDLDSDRLSWAALPALPPPSTTPLEGWEAQHKRLMQRHLEELQASLVDAIASAPVGPRAADHALRISHRMNQEYRQEIDRLHAALSEAGHVTSTQSVRGRSGQGAPVVRSLDSSVVVVQVPLGQPATSCPRRHALFSTAAICR
jgi:hypothetical protein